MRAGILIGYVCGWASLIALVGMCHMTKTDGIEEVRTEAVRLGHAERVVAPDGSTEFRWKDCYGPGCYGGTPNEKGEE